MTSAEDESSSAQHAYEDMRCALVKTIARKGNFSKAVLDALAQVPRHLFLPSGFTPEEAYADQAQPIGEEQTISQPYTVAYQTQLLDVQPRHRILEIGTGSGYQAAILWALGAEVFTIEYNRSLYQRTAQLLPHLGYSIHTFHGDGSQGLPEQAPFDRILVTAGAPELPETLPQQLIAGGKMVIPVGSLKNQRMVKVTRRELQQFDTEEFDLFSFVPLQGKYGWK